MSALAPFATKKPCAAEATRRANKLTSSNDHLVSTNQSVPREELPCAHGKKSASLRGRITLGGNDEAARVYRVYGRECRMAVRCAGAASGRTHRLGWLLPLTRDAPVNVAFFDELRRRGFIEGQNLTVEYRPWALHFDLVSQYAAELVKARVDVIITGGEETLRAAQEATKTIPILALAEDLLGSGL